MHKYDKKPQPNNEMRDSIPDSWFYNDAAASQLWTDMETIYDVAKAEQKRKDRETTLRKIDSSAHKLRQMINGFEISDQEFLMNLMDILDDDTAVDNVDRQSILMEARYKLSEILQEHSQSTEAQEKMIESLREWFMSVMQNQDIDGFPRIREKEPFSAAELRDMINVLCEKQELVTEEASTLHSTITNELQRRIRELQRDLEAKNVEIAKLKESLEQQKSSRRRGALYGKRPPPKKSEAMVALNSAQRKIAEQEGKIENLKQALAASGKEGDQDKVSITGSASNFSMGSTLPYDREMEYEQRIRYLTDQVSGLKSECSNYQTQMNSAKAAEIDLKNRLNSMERLKKNLEDQVAALNQKYNSMQEAFEKRIAALEKQEKGGDAQSVIVMKAEYEKKLADAKEEAVRQSHTSLELLEKRHKEHVADLLKAIKGEDHQVVVQTLLEQSEAKSKEGLEMYQKQIEALKQAQTDKVLSITKMYEEKLKLASINLDSQKTMFQSELESKLMNQKIELENSFRNEMAQALDEGDQRYSELKLRLTKKIDKISKLNQRLFRERDALRELIDENDASTIPTAEDELASEMPAGNEGDSDEDQNTNLYDEYYVQEKVREAKKEAEEKFSVMLKEQQEMLTKAREWDLQKQRNDLQAKADARLNEMRQSLMSHLTDLKDKMKDRQVGTDELDAMLNEVALSARQQEEMRQEMATNETMVPLSEVQKELEELRQTVLNVQNENSFLKRAVDKASQGCVTTDENGTDMIKAMRESVAEQAVEMNLILKENEQLKGKVMELEGKIESLKGTNLQDMPVSLPTVPGGFSAVPSMQGDSSATQGGTVEVDIGDEVVTLFAIAKKIQEEAGKSDEYLSISVKIALGQEDNLPEEQRNSLLAKEKEASDRITKLVSEYKGGNFRSRSRKLGNGRRYSIDSMTTESSEVFDLNPPQKRHRVSFEFSSGKPSQEQIRRMRQREDHGNQIRLGSGNYNSNDSLGDGVEPNDAARFGKSLDGSPSPFGESLDGSPSPFGRSLDGSPSPFGHSNEKPSSPLAREPSPTDNSKSLFGTSLDGSPSPFGQSSKGSSDSEERVGTPLSLVRKQTRQTDLMRMSPTSQVREIVTQKPIDIPVSFVNLNTDADQKLVILRPKHAVIANVAPSPVITQPEAEPAAVSTPSGGSAMERLRMQMMRQSQSEPASQPETKTVEAKRPLSICSTGSFSQRDSEQEKPIQEKPAEPKVVRPITGDPKDVSQYMAELSGFRQQMSTLKENSALLKAMYTEVAASTRELQVRHNEVVKVLTSALDSAMKLAKGDGEHPESLIEKMQEQAAYLTSAVKERESLRTTADHASMLLAERSQELIAIQEDLTVKDSKIDLLNEELTRATNALEENQKKISNLETLKSEYESAEEDRKVQMDFIMRKLSTSEQTKLHLQCNLDKVQEELQQAKNQLAVAQAKTAPDMVKVSPFLIFSVEQAPSLPRKGFGLSPAPETVIIDQPPLAEAPAPALVSSQVESPLVPTPASSAPPEPEPEPEPEPVPAQETQEPPPAEKIVVKSGGNAIKNVSLKKPLEPLKVMEARTKKSQEEFTTLQPVINDKNLVYVRALKKSTGGRRHDATQSTINVPTSVLGDGSYFTSHPITGKVIENQTVINLKQRIQQLESSLHGKVQEFDATREELHKVQQLLLESESSYSQLKRELRIRNAENNASKERINTSVVLITKLSTENERLRRLLKELTDATKDAAKHARIARYMKEDADFSAIGESRNRALLREVHQYGCSENSRRLAARHALAIARWEGRRQFLMQQEREHTMAVLRAMNLISDQFKVDIPVAVQPPEQPKKEQAPLIKVTTFGRQPEKRKERRQYPAPPPISTSPSMPTVDEAVKIAAKHNQRLPMKLRFGVVGRPIKI